MSTNDKQTPEGQWLEEHALYVLGKNKPYKNLVKDFVEYMKKQDVGMTARGVARKFEKGLNVGEWTPAIIQQWANIFNCTPLHICRGLEVAEPDIEPRISLNKDGKNIVELVEHLTITDADYLAQLVDVAEVFVDYDSQKPEMYFSLGRWLFNRVTKTDQTYSNHHEYLINKRLNTHVRIGSDYKDNTIDIMFSHLIRFEKTSMDGWAKYLQCTKLDICITRGLVDAGIKLKVAMTPYGERIINVVKQLTLLGAYDELEYLAKILTIMTGDA